MAALSKRFPRDLRYGVPFDTTVFVKDSIDEVYTTLYEAGLLVLVVILVFLQNFRATLVPATTVPVTIIGAFAGMAALGYTINLSTLFGIVLAIGIVVDDAIVIVEGASKYIERGLSGHDASIQAMKELFGPIIGITLVLMAVFVPPAFLPGISGKMLAQFAVVIATTALISAINAATLKPTQCAQWLRPAAPGRKNPFYRAFNQAYDFLEAHYTRLVGVLVKRAGAVVLVGLAISALGILGLARLPRAFIPNEDQGYAMTAVQLPEGASLERTVSSLSEAAKIALVTPGVKDVITVAGVSVLDTSAVLSSAGVNYVIFDEWAKRAKAKDQDLLPLVMGLQKKVETISTGRPTCSCRRRSRASETPAVSRCKSIFWAAASIMRSSEPSRRTSSRARKPILKFNAFSPPSAPISAYRPYGRPRPGRVAEGLRWRRVLRFDLLRRLDIREPVREIRASDAGLCPGRLQYRLQPEDLLNMYVRGGEGQHGGDRDTGASRAVDGATLDRALQPVSVSSGHRRARSRLQLGTGDGGYGGDRRQDAAKRRGLRLERDFLPGEGHRQSAVCRFRPFGPLSSISCSRVNMRAGSCRLPSSPRSLSRVGRARVDADEPRRRQQSLRSNRADAPHRPVRQERHSDRRGGARGTALSTASRAIEAAVEAARFALPPHSDDLHRLHPRRSASVLATGAGANARKSLGISVFTGMISSTVLAVVLVPSFFVALQNLDERFGRKTPPKKNAERAGELAKRGSC